MRALSIGLVTMLVCALAAPAFAQEQRLRPDQFVIGSARFDMSTLTVAPGPVARRGIIASGMVGYAMVGRLQQDFLDGVGVKFAAPAGTLLHRVQIFNPENRSLAEAWCGEFEAQLLMMRNEHRTICLQHIGEWTVIYPAKEDHTTLVSVDEFVAADRVRSPLHVIPEQAPPAAFPMEILLAGINAQRAQLAIVVHHDGDNTTIWRGNVGFYDGVGMLPMWSHQLNLQSAGATLTATLTPNGDGRGPLDRAVRD